MIIPRGYESGLSKWEITNMKPIVIESRDVFKVMSTILKILFYAFITRFPIQIHLMKDKMTLKIT